MNINITETFYVVFGEFTNCSLWKNRIHVVGVFPMFIGPLQQIKLEDSNIELVNTKICLGLKVDSRLKWYIHAMEVVEPMNEVQNENEI